MGGKNKSSNNAQLQFEMQQAEEAKQKEAARQARLQQGSDAINKIFAAAADPNDPNYINYDKYHQAYLDYYNPQLKTQYTEATRGNKAALARSGSLWGSEAGRTQGYLDTQNYNAQAALGAQADTGTAQLRQQTESEKQAALSQLYSTEDPTISANTAAHAVQQGAIATPNVQPLGAIFSPIAIGSTAALNNAINNYNINQGLRLAQPTGSGSGITTNTV